LRSDLIVKELLRFLDEKVGKGRYVLVLTADHGVCPLPEHTRALGKPAGRVHAGILGAGCNEFLIDTLGGGRRTRWIEAAATPWTYLNLEALKRANLKPENVEKSLAEGLRGHPAIKAAYTRTQLMAGVPKDDEIGQAVRLSFHPDRCGDVMVVPKLNYI